MDFDALHELVQSITRNKIKNIEVLGNPGQKKTRLEKMYAGIVSGKFTSDEDIAQHFFKDKSSRNANYRKLKNRFIRQLVNTALFVDINNPSFNDRAKAYFAIYQDFAAASTLMARGNKRPALFIYNQIVDRSIEYEFTDLASDCLRILRMEFSDFEYEKRDQINYLHQKYEEKHRYEMVVLDCFESLISYYVTKRSPSQEIHKLATKYYEDLSPLSEIVNTSFFYCNYYSIGIIKYISINDLQNALQVCNKALDALEKRKNTNRSTLVNFVLQKMGIYIQLKNTDKNLFQELLGYCLNILEEGDFSWFRVYEVYFYYCFYFGHYSDAMEVYKKISKSPRFQLLDGSFHDNWLLLGGYLHLLAKLGVLDPSQVEQVVGTFRFGKLINEIGVLSKDKEGMNIPLTLLPVLYHLAQGTFYRQSVTTVEALEKYRQRWLNNDMNRRSDSFVKLLIAYTQIEDNPAVAEMKIQKELETLKSQTPDIAGQTWAVEIVPYETLWDLLIAKK